MAKYREPVNGMGVRILPEKMRDAMKAVQHIMPPNTGIIVFAFDFNGGGMGYISNAVREDAIASLKEWIALQEAKR